MSFIDQLLREGVKAGTGYFAGKREAREADRKRLIEERIAKREADAAERRRVLDEIALARMQQPQADGGAERPAYDVNQDPVILRQELLDKRKRENLARAGYKPDEIEVFIATGRDPREKPAAERPTSYQFVPGVTTGGAPGKFNPQTGEVTPVTSGGKPMEAAKPRLSPVAQKTITESNALVSDIDNALGLLQARPEGIGPLIGRTPDIIRQKRDPEGIALRSAIANVGSTITLMRSGGAVSDQEFARIRPFIPSENDRPEAARIKLGELRKYLERKASAASGDTEANSYPENPYR